MPLLFPQQPAFTSGRLSPKLHSRIDLQQYATGLTECDNFIVLQQGGASFRSGTSYVQPTKGSDFARLLPFVFSNTQAYIFELGEGYIRIFTNHGPLIDGGAQIELTVPYTQDQINAVNWDQSGDIMILVNRNHPPHEIRREGATTWNSAVFDYRDGPYLDENVTATTLTPSASTGSITITASAVTGINGGRGFLATDVGRHVRLLQDSVWGWAIITAVNSTTEVVATVQDADLAGTAAATANWRLGAWSDTDGYPEAVRFHQQRLFFARGQTIWGSASGIFRNFSPTNGAGEVLDTNSVTYVLAAGKIDLIQWLASSRTLEVGSGGAEFTLSGGGSFGLDSPLTPDSVLARKHTENGSFEIGQPIFSDRGTVFINRSGRKVLNFYYSFENDSYQNDDLTLLADDLTFPYIFELAYQAEPDMIIWAVRSDGVLLGCTYNPRQKVVAWHQHHLGGSYQGGNAVVESVVVIPAPGGTRDELWLSVLRTINGQTVRYIEFMEPMYGPGSSVEQATFVDSSLCYSGPPENTFGGLAHLEGQEVSILADGSTHPRRTVVNGIVELDRLASEVVIGLPYQGELTLLPFEPGDTSNAVTGRRSRILSVGLSYYQTLLAKVGVVGKPLERIGGRSTTDNLGEPLTPTNGFERVPIESNDEQHNRITVVQEEPLPCTILSVYPIMETV